jgi:hypothetical protein
VRLLQLAASLLAALALAGCGGSDDEDDGGSGDAPPDGGYDCTMDVGVSGAVTGTTHFNGCSNFYLESGQLTVNYIDFELDWSVTLDIGPVTADTPATGVPAEVGVIVQPEQGELQRFTAASTVCTVDLTVFEAVEDEFFGPGHNVKGEGRCSGPAAADTSTAAMGEVTIAPFQFQFFANNP